MRFKQRFKKITIINLMLSKEQIRKNREATRCKLAGSLIIQSQQSVNEANQDLISPSTKRRKRYLSAEFSQIDFFWQFEGLSVKSTFEQDFQLLQKIGEGTEARVYKCRQKTSGKIYAVKIIKSSDLQTQIRIRNQFTMIQKLKHRNIIEQLFFYFDEENKRLMIVSQFYPYSTLQSAIRRRNGAVFPEEQIKFIISEILDAIKYLHQRGICHRDVKPDNILYDAESKKLVLLDLQIAKELKKEEGQFIQMFTNTGNIFYKAPEFYQGGYNMQVDIWAIGVVCYQLAYSALPFFSQFQEDLIELVKNYEPKFDEAVISQDCQNFIKKCLQKEPIKRYTAFQASNSPFVLCEKENEEQNEYKKGYKNQTPQTNDGEVEQKSFYLAVANMRSRQHKLSVSTGCSRSKSAQKIEDLTEE